MNSAITNIYQEYYKLWLSEFTDGELSYFNTPNADISSFIHLISTIDSEDFLSNEGKEYLSKIKSMSCLEKLTEYQKNRFFYNSFLWNGTTSLDTLIPEYSICIRNEAFTGITETRLSETEFEDGIKAPLTGFQYTDVLIIHNYFAKNVLPKTSKGVYYFDSCDELFLTFFDILVEIEEERCTTLYVCGEHGVGKKHFVEVLSYYCEILPNMKMPQIEFLIISAEELTKTQKEIIPTTANFVYIPSIYEILNRGDIYEHHYFPLPFIMTIDKAIDAQLKYEKTFWGKSTDAILNHIKQLSRKKQLWSICAIRTGMFYGIANSMELGESDFISGDTKILLRSNSRWIHNYEDLYRYVMTGLRFGDWDYGHSYHHEPDSYYQEYQTLFNDIWDVPLFSEKQVDIERHKKTIARYMKFKEKYDDQIVILMLRIRAARCSSIIRAELIKGELEPSRIDRIWSDVKKELLNIIKTYRQPEGKYKILMAIVKKFKVSLE